MLQPMICHCLNKRTFISLAFETLRTWEEEAKCYFTDLGKRITVSSHEASETDFQDKDYQLLYNKKIPPSGAV